MGADTSENTLVDQSYRKLRAGIIKGEFAPGEKLRIAKLKSYLAIGPTPIREALSRLTFSGLVIAEPNRGFFVKKISEPEMKDIYEIFAEIELLALERAIDFGDADWEGNIVAALHKLSAVEISFHPINAEKWLTLNYEFHLAMISGCKSPTLLKVREDVYQLFDRYCYLSLMANPKFLPQNNEDHSNLARAVIARDKALSRELMQQHLQNSFDQVRLSLKKNKVL